VGANPLRLLATAKLAGFTGAIAGRSSTASNVTQTGNCPAAVKTLKLLPIAPENALRPNWSSAAAWSCQLSEPAPGVLCGAPSSLLPMGARRAPKAMSGLPAQATAANTP